MAVAAETAAEIYAGSTATLSQWGAARLVERTACVETVETAQFEKLSYNDFASALREMLRTDPEFNEVLDIDDRRQHTVLNGQTRDAAGRPMTEVIANGRKSSQALIADYPELAPLAVRDEGDEIIAEQVDNLQPGETLFALSMEPKQELQKHKKAYTSLGFREGLVFIQTYSRVDDGTLIAGSYSVDKSDKATWQQLWTEFGAEVPPDVDPNMFIRHSVKHSVSAEEADQLARGLRQKFYERRGIEGERFSITEFTNRHEEVARGFFDMYYPSLAEAASSRQNNPLMQEFARTILSADLSRLKPEILREVQAVAVSADFGRTSVRAMDSIIRYAVVEELRKDLAGYILQAPQRPSEAMTWVSQDPYRSTTIPVSDIIYTNRLLTYNLSLGIDAGRGYGGCPGQIEMAEEYDSASTTVAGSRQMAYGGRSSSAKVDEECEFVSKECPMCHKKNVKTKVTESTIKGDCGCKKHK